MVMEAVEKKPHVEDDASPKTKKEENKEDETKEPVAKKRKTAPKLDHCKNQCSFLFLNLIFLSLSFLKLLKKKRKILNLKEMMMMMMKMNINLMMKILPKKDQLDNKRDGSLHEKDQTML